MSIAEEIKYTSIDDLFLDPLNPRLGLYRNSKDYTQTELLDKLLDFALEEIALSYIENGFWPQEALIIIEEEYMGKKCKLVVEGNRRLAALKYLRDTKNGHPPRSKWRKLVEGKPLSKQLFIKVPYLLASSRKEIAAFLGFRHVTGIKQWDAEEKAGFITQLRDKEKLSFEVITKKIGSKIHTVKRHYLAYKVLSKIREEIEIIEEHDITGRFTVLYMAIDLLSAKRFLNIEELNLDEDDFIKNINLENLRYFSIWLFGNNDVEALVNDTREVSKFGKILECPEAIDYLKRNKKPNIDLAFRKAGGDKQEIIDSIRRVSDNIEMALTQIHFFKNDEEMISAVKRANLHWDQLMSIFKGIIKDD